MKNLILVAAAAAMFLSVPGTLFAADIDNVSGQSCGDLEGEWHFVANQLTRDDGMCYLSALWTTGDNGCVEVTPSKTNRSTQHFYCTASGELLGATTDPCGGRLVLSDFSCDDKEPPCEPDPKTGECPKDPDPK